MEENKPECFVIMPISDMAGYEKGHFTKVYKQLIKPAIERVGYDPKRADEIVSTNLIVVDIIERILTNPIVICDISACNPNVFYELGIRHSTTLPVVLIKDSKANNPFDIKDIRYVEYSDKLEYENVVIKQKEIADAIIVTMEDYEKGICKNSYLQLLHSLSENKDKTALRTDLSFLEKEAKNISELINSAYSDSYGNGSIASLIFSFRMLCSKYSNGIELYYYLKAKYAQKFPSNAFFLL